MAITLEQVEKLREKTHISYEDAKNALEQNQGDLLDTLIFLERRGRAQAAGGGFFSTEPGAQTQHSADPQTPPPPCGGTKRAARGGNAVGFWAQLGHFMQAIGRILRHSTRNQFEVWRRDEKVTSVPVLILVILTIVAFYVVVPLLLLGPFFGWHYRFSGPDLGRAPLNDAMGAVAGTVDRMVDQMRHEFGAAQK